MAKILIVDDAQFMRMTLASILKKANYEIVGEAANGEEAIQRFKETKPDLIFMDITMPVMNGLEAIKSILHLDKNANTVGQQKVVVQAIELGAKDFITKPFDETRLLETIKRVLHLKNNSVTDMK